MLSKILMLIFTYQIYTYFQIVNTKFTNLPPFLISNSEIIKFVNELRDYDVNKAKLLQIELDYQGHTSNKNLEDNAKKQFFKKVDKDLLLLPTYSKFIALHNNYYFDTCKLENNSPEENKEVDAFIDSIMDTKVFKYLRKFLHEHDHPIATSEKNMRQELKKLWFDQYSRGCNIKDTSGFEHVFLGENKNNEISGLHDWIRLYLIEKNSTLYKFDYKGFIVKRSNIFAAIKYAFEDLYKRVGSFLIGTSPEFNFALYTFCFLARRGHKSTCDFEIDGCPISITSFEINQNNKVYIGSIYPSAGRITKKCQSSMSKQH